MHLLFAILISSFVSVILLVPNNPSCYTEVFVNMPAKNSCERLHPQRSGGPCKVCLKEEGWYWHIGQAISPKDLTVSSLRALGCSDDDCICQACQKKYSKKSDVADSQKGAKRALAKECAVEGCTSDHRIHETDLLSFPQEVLIRFGLDFCSSSATPSSIITTLCHKHYCNLYRQSFTKNCSMCGSPQSTLKQFKNVQAAQSFAVAILQKHEMSDTGSFELCNVCYTSVNRYSKGEKYTEANRGNKTYFSSLLQPFRDVTLENSSASDFAFVDTLLYIGDELLNDRVILLQSAYNMYCKKLTPSSYTEADPPTVPLTRSLHSFLCSLRSAVGECIIISSIPNKSRYGTMIRRWGTDLCTALHLILFEQHQNSCEPTQQPETSSVSSSTHSISLSCISRDINNHLTKSAKEIIASDKASSYNLDTVDFYSEVKRLPPVVWNFIVARTLGPSELSSDFFARNFNWQEHLLANTHPSDSVSHSKFLKRFFIACSLLYATNDSCFTHVHMLVGDIVDRFTSSSSLCFDYLSKFGVTVSKSTFLRFQTKISTEEMRNKHITLSSSFL
ncbi:hypothetical protein HOLleu_10220 [Holothuria leucospilota]|uniref:Uncharacterized protein n=1 Tax=Holothuria leucospilota TaxID=206669 RepID=A0A9Q1CE15_HOLLE|nr:hypothetical protein HOLleu_10220 [Holothuria leucospilota]